MTSSRIAWRCVIVDMDWLGSHHASIAHALGVSRTAVLAWKNNEVVDTGTWHFPALK